MNAPATRTVCQLTGERAPEPSKFFQALAATTLTFEYALQLGDGTYDTDGEGIITFPDLDAARAHLEYTCAVGRRYELAALAQAVLVRRTVTPWETVS